MTPSKEEIQAREKAERIVYVDYTISDIVWACEQRGLPTTTKNGTRRARWTLESTLIKAMTKEFMEQGKR